MSAAPFGRYLQAANTLRNALRQNTRDSRFANEQNGTIVYLIDTNIVEAFLRSDQMVLIKERDSDLSTLFTEDAAKIVEQLTAYFLFEGDLPGQMKASVYQSPAHWNETLHRVDVLAQNAIGEVTVANAELSDAVYRELLPLAGNPTELITRAETLGVAKSLQKLADTVSLTGRIKRLWQDDERKVRRLQSLQQSPYWTAAIDSIRREDFAFWSNKLRQKRGGDDKTPSIENDAMTLAVMQALYREHPESIGPQATLRFHLITADAVLATVIEECGERLVQEGVSPFVRPPTVFIPLLNFGHMNRELRKDDDTKSVFQEIDSAVRALLPFDRGQAMTSRRQSVDIAENVKRWSEVARRVAIVGARYFEEDFGEHDRNWRAVARLFENPEVISTAGRLLRETIIEIKSEHTQQATGAAIAELATKVRAGRKRHEPTAAADSRLFPKFLDVEILRPLRGLPGFEPQSLTRLELFIAALKADADANTKGAIEQVVARLRSTWRDPSLSGPSYLLASSIYFSTGAWESARVCADLCRRSLGSKNKNTSIWEREARYVEALALRMTMRSRTEVELATKHLLKNMAAATAKTRLAYLRDRVEHSALMMTASVVQWIENSTPMEDFGEDGARIDLMDAGDLRSEFDEAVGQTSEALEELRHNFDDSSPLAIASRIRVQGGANLLGASLFAHFFFMESKEGVDKAREQFEKLLQETNSTASPGMEVYLRCARLIASPSSEGVRKFRDYVALGVRKLSEPDKIEQGYLSDRVNSLVL